MSFISHIQQSINSKAEITGTDKNTLKEKRTTTKVQLQTTGSYLLYDFELIKQPLFPFFAKNEETKGLNSIADYVIFTESKGKLFAVVVELKKNEGRPENQLYATKQFLQYLINSVNRIFKVN